MGDISVQLPVCHNCLVLLSLEVHLSLALLVLRLLEDKIKLYEHVCH